MKIDQTSLTLTFLKAMGKISSTGAEKLEHCSSTTGIGLEQLLAMCGTLRSSELLAVKQAVSGYANNQYSYLKALLLLGQSLSMQDDFEHLVSTPLFSRLNALSLYLLQMGLTGLSQLQALFDSSEDLPSEIDGLFLWRAGLITVADWRQALIELRLVEIGKASIDQFEAATKTANEKLDLDELFSGNTWLLSMEALANPILLNYLEASICNSRHPNERRAHSNIPVSLEMQRLIVALKAAMHAGKINANHAKKIASLAYAAPDMAATLVRTFIADGHINVARNTDLCATRQDLPTLDCFSRSSTTSSSDMPIKACA